MEMEDRHIQRSAVRPGYIAGIAVLLLFACAAACRISSTSDDQDAAPAAVIGSEGGVVEVADRCSGIYGAKVYIPGGALDREQCISLIAEPLPAELPGGYLEGGGCVDFRPDGISFLKPVLLYLPYADVNSDGIIDGRAVREENAGVLRYDSLRGRWEEMPLYGVDAGRNLAVVESEHFSTYLVYVDASDIQTLDSDVVDIDVQPAFEAGECYLGNDNVCHYSHLTLLRRDSGWTAVVDRNLTYVESGHIAAVSKDGASAVFDAASAFSKVLSSGDATLWNWECEFVREYTYLKDYEVREDDSLSSSDTGDTGTDPGTDDSATEGIFCRIEAIDAHMVRIDWHINAFEQVIYQTTPQGNGHCLAIRFRATYQ